MANIIQQLEDLKEWAQNPERYARRLEFRHRSGAPGMEVLPQEFDELSPREEEYYKQEPFSTREDFLGAKGGVAQLVQPGPEGVRHGYQGKKEKGLGKNIDLLIEAYNTEAPGGPIKKKIQQKIIETKEFKKFFTPEKILEAPKKPGWTRDMIKTLEISRLHMSLLPDGGKGFISAGKLADKLGIPDYALWNGRRGAISQSELKGRAPHLGTKYPAYNYNKIADLLNVQPITVKGQKHYYFKDPGIKDMKFLQEFMKKPILQQDTVQAMNIINNNSKITTMMEKRIFPDIEIIKNILKDAKLPHSDGNAATAMLRLAEVYKGGTFKNEIGIGTNKLIGNFIDKKLDGYDMFHPWSKGTRDATIRIITQNMPDKAGNLQTFKTSIRQAGAELGVNWEKWNLNEVFSVSASKSNKAYPYAYFVDVMDAGLNKEALKAFHGSLSKAQSRLITKIDKMRATQNPQFRKALYKEAQEIIKTFDETRASFANTIKTNYPGKKFNLANIVLGKEKAIVAKDFKIPANVYSKAKLDKWATKGVNIAEHARTAGYVMTGADKPGVKVISEFFTPESRLVGKKVMVASTLDKFLKANGVNICG